MLVATIRSTETRTVELEGETLIDLQTQLKQNCPAGFQLASAPLTMIKSSTRISTTGTYVRRDGTQELEGETLDAIQAQTPEGWQVITLRAE